MITLIFSDINHVLYGITNFFGLFVKFLRYFP